MPVGFSEFKIANSPVGIICMSKIKRIRIVLQDKLLNLAKQCGSVLFYDTTDADSGSLSSHCVSKVYISK